MLYSRMMIVNYLDKIDSWKCDTILEYLAFLISDTYLQSLNGRRLASFDSTLDAAKHSAIVPCMIDRQHNILLTWAR